MERRELSRSLMAIAMLTLGTFPLRLAGQDLTPDRQLARDVLAELIGINTTHEHGNTTPAAEAMAR